MVTTAGNGPTFTKERYLQWEHRVVLTYDTMKLQIYQTNKVTCLEGVALVPLHVYHRKPFTVKLSLYAAEGKCMQTSDSFCTVFITHYGTHNSATRVGPHRQIP